ncbi:MAG TPA: tol-pal system protein YbgF [Paracoccaceae bacterium]|nr:tol-pal system protein YbgF [Paracoccaceae bacterium]
MILACVLAGLLPLQAAAQAAPAPGTLEDIRQNLAAIDAQVQALRRQLAATGGALPPASGNPLQRLDALEAQVRFLTGRVEQVQNEVRRMAEDAGRRYADVEFRLTEIEGGDTALLGDPLPLGGGTPEVVPGTEGIATAVTEQNAFDAAQQRLEENRLAEAAQAFRAFIAEYPGSPLTQQASFGLAEAQLRSGATREAAKSYLSAFNAAPSGPKAPDALVGVGVALQELGQFPEACLTFAEVARRFPNAAPEVLSQVAERRAAIGCQ